MADNTRKLIIAVELEGGQIVKADLRDIEKLGNRAVGASRQLKNIDLKTTYLTASQAIRDTAIVVRGLWQETVSLSKESGYAKAAVAELNAALKSQGNYTDEASQELQNFAQLMQQTADQDADAFIKTLARAESAIAADERQLQMMGRAAIGLSSILKTNVDSAMNQVIGSMNGQDRVMRRLGITVDKSWTQWQRLEAILEATDAGFAKVQATAAEGEGKIRRAERAWGDLREKVGDVVTGNTELMDSIVELIEDDLPPLIDLVGSAVTTFSKWPTWLQATTLGFWALSPAIQAVNVALGTGGLLGVLTKIAGLMKTYPILGTILKGGSVPAIGLSIPGSTDASITEDRVRRKRRQLWDKQHPGFSGPVSDTQLAAFESEYYKEAKSKLDLAHPAYTVTSGGILDVPAPAVVSGGSRRYNMWRDLRGQFDSDAYGQIAGSALNGGFGDALATAGGIAGGAFGPIGALAGSWLGKGIGKMFGFGGGGGGSRDGQTRSTAYQVELPDAVELLTQIASNTRSLQLRAMGLGIDQTTAGIALSNARTGFVGEAA
ncbi:MAG TPA: hypothetical protein VD932_03505 [Aquabacterium sp.]|nr:hypothetical protein [Aquabacterium sp.]